MLLSLHPNTSSTAMWLSSSMSSTKRANTARFKASPPNRIVDPGV
jgi:hypothetical protein